MPRFDFQCKKCSATFEESLPFGSTKKPACPSCKSTSVEKLIALPGIVFKGSGWYKTDSRPKGEPRLNDAAGRPVPKTPATKEEPKKQETKSETSVEKPVEKRKNGV